MIFFFNVQSAFACATVLLLPVKATAVIAMVMVGGDFDGRVFVRRESYTSCNAGLKHVFCFSVKKYCRLTEQVTRHTHPSWQETVIWIQPDNENKSVSLGAAVPRAIDFFCSF